MIHGYVVCRDLPTGRRFLYKTNKGAAARYTYGKNKSTVFPTKRVAASVAKEFGKKGYVIVALANIDRERALRHVEELSALLAGIFRGGMSVTFIQLRRMKYPLDDLRTTLSVASTEKKP